MKYRNPKNPFLVFEKTRLKSLMSYPRTFPEIIRKITLVIDVIESQKLHFLELRK